MHRDSRVPRVPRVRGLVQFPKDSRIQGFKDSRIQGFKDSTIQGIRALGCKGSRVQGLRGSGVQGHLSSLLRGDSLAAHSCPAPSETHVVADVGFRVEG